MCAIPLYALLLVNIGGHKAWPGACRVVNRIAHASAQEHVRSANFVCFNLGFLPGGERSIITRPASTIAALRAAVDILQPQGLISMLCYLGHSGGMEEYEAVRHFAMQMHPGKVYVLEQRILNRPLSPVLILFWKKTMLDE